ncbi:tyrosinase cofactor [Streptomyces sp. NPDC060027]|uniref:tyrosinase cofactor n=1 Tax=Streptomyces sp. NPDC060027 TaxID=3347040 RepID=UPI00369A517E
MTRRGAMRGLLVSAVGVALAPVVAASRPPHPLRSEDLSFDEVYRGRHILGTKSGSDGTAAAVSGGEWQVTVDGRPLHLMRRADGGYLSMVDHYESYPTPLAAARAAVDELGPAERLRAMEDEEAGADAGGARGSDAEEPGLGGRGVGGSGARDSGTEGSGHHHGVHA